MVRYAPGAGDRELLRELAARGRLDIVASRLERACGRQVALEGRRTVVLRRAELITATRHDAAPTLIAMGTVAPNDLRAALAGFVAWRKQYLSGDEKGEAQIFCDRLFQALGHGGVREAGATLEMRLKKHDRGGTAFADLMWKPRCLIEMKRAGTDLQAHFRQAFDYWVLAVPNRPRYVILCNFDELWIYDFDNQLDAPVDRLSLDDLPQRVDALSFMLPIAAPPVFGNDLVKVTRDAAAQVGTLFRQLTDRGIERLPAQRFVLQSVMAMFSEDIGLLPGKFFTRSLEEAPDPSDVYDRLLGLFTAMNTAGVTPAGRFAGTPYFNGGLFADIGAVLLTKGEVEVLHGAASKDWSDVRPEIFGTLFEGAMEEGERHATGAHFTSQADIVKVVGPTIVDPWRERLSVASSIQELEKIAADMFTFRVLDPACGSGNFLYVAYREMRRLEHEARQMIANRRRSSGRAQQGGLSWVTPDHFFGIDINPFAVEVAKVTMMLGKKLAADELDEVQEVLPLDNLDSVIVAGDALFTKWPAADVIVGNPPYLGRRKMARELGASYTQKLKTAFPNVGGVSDFVTYWFPLTNDHLSKGGRAGLVATNTVRENDSREVSLDYVVDHGGVITEAVSSQPWSGDAAVTVSIINWIKEPDAGTAKKPKVLWLDNGTRRLTAPTISSALSPEIDVRKADDLNVNKRPAVCHQGQTPGLTTGFELDQDERAKLTMGSRSGELFIYPFLGGEGLLKTLTTERFVIDLPQTDLIEAKSVAPQLVEHLQRLVLPTRQSAADREREANEKILAVNPSAKVNRHHANFLNRWWQMSYRRTDMLDAAAKCDRYIATSRVASERRATVFEFVDPAIRPGDSLSVVTLADDYSFGIMSSSAHRTWLEARCSTLESRLRYTPTTVWNSFPWPQDPTDKQVVQIVDLVVELTDLRVGYLARGITLAKQYDALRAPGQSALRDIHLRLDAAVIAAYGFDAELDLLTQLYALNQQLASHQSGAQGPGGASYKVHTKTTYRRTA